MGAFPLQAPMSSAAPSAEARADQPGTTPPVVEMRNLTMRWSGRPVLDSVNLTLVAGERLVVVGPSGAGKSTILRLLAGLLLPTSGELFVHGERQTYLRLDQRHPPDVRFVFQNPALIASLTVRENVGFLLYRFSRLGEAEIRERVRAALASVGLAGIEDRLPGELSGGMQKRVSFARALIDDPASGDGRVPLLLFDEPTAGLDPVASTRVEELIVRTTTMTHGTGVVVSHVMSTIEGCAQKVALLYDGHFRWCGTLEEFRRTDNPYVVQFRSGSLQGPMQPTEL